MSSRFIAAALVIATASCGSEPAYVSGHGMAVYIESDRLPADRDFGPLEVAVGLALDLLAQQVPRRELEGLLGRSELHLYSRTVECDGQRKWGCYSEGGRIDAVGWTDCPTEWLLDHELVHMAQEADGRGQSHAEPMFGDGSWASELHDQMVAQIRECDNLPIY